MQSETYIHKLKHAYPQVQFVELASIIDELYRCCRYNDPVFYSRVFPRFFLPICYQTGKSMYKKLEINDIEQDCLESDPRSSSWKTGQRFTSRRSEEICEGQDAALEAYNGVLKAAQTKLGTARMEKIARMATKLDTLKDIMKDERVTRSETSDFPKEKPKDDGDIIRLLLAAAVFNHEGL